MTKTDPPRTSEVTSKSSVTRGHIRGSMLLLGGRFISLGLNFVGQILIVRYLSMNAYGSYAFALSIVTLGSTIAVFGMDTTFSRFVSIYKEKQDYPRLFGAIVFAFAFVCGLGLTLAAGVYGLRGVIGGTLIDDPLSMTLLIALLLFIPLNALDRVFEASMAVMGNPKAIFFRRHVLGPGFKVAAIVSVMLIGGSALAMAIGFLVATTLGVLAYASLFMRALQKEGLARHFSRARLLFTPRRLLRFSLPMLGADLGPMVRFSVVMLLLEATHDSANVATFSAVLSLAELNKLVLHSFGFMFIPSAARLIARGQSDQVNDLYWQCSCWIGLLTLPIFLVCFGLGEPISVLFFGSDYAQSGAILSVLSIGNYLHAVLGFNSATLKALGKTVAIFWVEMIGTIAALLFSILLIPPFGALGAAAAVCASTIFQNAIAQFALSRTTNVKALRLPLFGLYFAALASAMALLGLQNYASPPLVVGMAAAAAIALIIMRAQGRLLSLDENFPEIEKLSFIHIFTGTRKKQRL